MQTFEDARNAARNALEEDEFINEENSNDMGAIDEMPEEGLDMDSENYTSSDTVETVQSSPQGEGNGVGDVNNPQLMTNQQVSITEQAVQTAEQASLEVQRLSAQLQQVQQQNQQLQSTIQQMNEQHTQAVMEQAAQNETPVLDFAALAFDDEEHQREKMGEFANQMTEYVSRNIMADIAPFVEEAKRGQKAKDFEDAISAVAANSELSGITNSRELVEQIMENNPIIAASDAPMADKLMMAYTMLKGVESIKNPPREQTPEELLERYKNDSEFQGLVEKERIKAVKNQPKIPPLSAGGGAGNAALNIPEKPKTFAEAREWAKKQWK